MRPFLLNVDAAILSAIAVHSDRVAALQINFVDLDERKLGSFVRPNRNVAVAVIGLIIGLAKSLSLLRMTMCVAKKP